jgi:Uma2 family endonuclease
MHADTAFRSEECFTQKEFRRWVEHRPRTEVNRYELIDGRIVMTPPAGQAHGSLEVTLARLIDQHVLDGKLGSVFGSSTGYDLPSGDTLEPDLSFVTNERMAAGPRTGPDQFLRVVPTLVIEILSPSTARRDRTEKKSIYERNGVDEYWLVDPRQKTVMVFHLTESAYDTGTTFSSGSVRSHVLPRLRLAISKLFAA